MRRLAPRSTFFALAFAFFGSPPVSAEDVVPVFGLFEKAIVNNAPYSNPFADVELETVFTSPSGRVIDFFGFHDGDGSGGQIGTVWKQRFMPDELGTWAYTSRFSDDDSVAASGTFDCVESGGKRGPWKQHPSNFRWLTDSRGEPFLPIGAMMWLPLSRSDWRDGIEWALAKGYNTIVTPTFNDTFWGDGWKNPTPFVAQSGDPDRTGRGSQKRVDYDRPLIARWKDWDDMIEAAGEAGLYISPTNTPNGFWGGQSGTGTIYPPKELAYFPDRYHAFHSPHNIRMVRYFLARQGAYWNIAHWSLYPGEVYEIKSEEEVIAFGNYLASVTPFGRMITAQDIEQSRQGVPNRTWLSDMRFEDSRKINTIQIGHPNGTRYQDAGEVNDFARELLQRGFPVLATEALWEGQSRAGAPLNMIWGSLMAGANLAWADFSPEDPDAGNYRSLGHNWLPIKPLSVPQFRPDQLGADVKGDEYLAVAGRVLAALDFWKMESHNELVAGGESYCLADPGSEYIVYVPRGVKLRLDLAHQSGAFSAKWIDPKTGDAEASSRVYGNSIRSLRAPTHSDWVLVVTKMERQ